MAFAGGSSLDGAFATRTLTVLKSATVQASLSTLCSALLAVPAAVSLARFRGYGFYQPLRLLCGVAFIVPTTVAATGLLEIWGRQGIVAAACHGLTAGSFCDGMTVYGLHGVVLAHMFLNVPLMILVFLSRLEQVPPAHYDLAHHLGMTRHNRFRLIEWPVIHPTLPGIMVLVFLLCFSSFSLVLMLGGGPRVTTLEVEIYAAIRFDFDFAAAAGLSLIQFVSAVIVVGIMAYWGDVTRGLQAHDSPLTAPRQFGDSKWVDAVMLSLFFIIVALPVLMVILAGFNNALIDMLGKSAFWSVMRNSLLIAISSALATVTMGLVLAVARARIKAGSSLMLLIDGGVMLYLVLPAIVLGTAAFIALRDLGDIFVYAFWVVVLANALLALPFAVRVLEGRLRLIFKQHDRMAYALGVYGFNRWRLLTFPQLHRELGTVLGLSAAISMGDLGVIALFASDQLQTLPWMLYQTAGRYQADAAKALALLLLVLAMTLLLAGRYLPILASGRKYHADH